MKSKVHYILIFLFLGYSPIAKGQVLKKLGKKISEVSKEISKEIETIEQVTCLFSDRDCINRAKSEGKKVILKGPGNSPGSSNTQTTSVGNQGFAVHDESNSFNSGTSNETYEILNREIKLSSNGTSIANLTLQGSRKVVKVNGIAGPVADNIFFESFVFSPSGKRHAYLGQFGQDCNVIVDGKMGEQITCPDRYGNNFNNNPMFYFTEDDATMLVSLGKTNLQMKDILINEKKIEGVFNPLIIRGNDIFFVKKNNEGYSVYHNGKIGPEYSNIKGLVVSYDGKNYAYVAHNKGGQIVVINGKETHAYKQIYDLNMDLRNGKVIYRTDINTVIDGKVIDFSRGTYFKSVSPAARTGLPAYMINAFKNSPMNSNVIFNPVGDTYAYVVTGSASRMETVFINGKSLPSFENIDYLSFTGDGKKLIFIGRNSNKYFLVVEGKEFGPFDYVANFIVSEKGNSYAFQARNGNEKNHWYVNGEKIAQAAGDKLFFSPDGSRYAFVSGTGHQTAYVIDGMEYEGSISGFWNSNLETPPFNFNPITNELAYIIRESYDGGKFRDVLIYGDNKLTGNDHRTNFSYPSFSADGKHFAVLMGQRQYGAPTQWKLFLDLKPGPLIGQQTSSKPEFSSFLDNKTYKTIGIMDGQLDVFTVSFN